MLSFLTSRLFPRKLDETPGAILSATSEALPEVEDSTLVATIGWITAAFGALAVGLFVGRELRQRYKFNRRTPYDFYAHSGGDEMQDVEFGVGV